MIFFFFFNNRLKIAKTREVRSFDLESIVIHRITAR